MSVEPIDLAAFGAWVSRADASPAPTRDIPPRTGDNQVPSRIGPQHVPFKACGCGVLAGEQCDCADLAAQLEAHLARPIWFGRKGRAA